MTILIPMAGAGSRFKDVGINTPKPLLPIDETVLITKVLENLPKGDLYIFLTRPENEEERVAIRNAVIDYQPQKIIEITNLTEGAACTCLLAEKEIPHFEPLLIANCDQLEQWDIFSFEDFLRNTTADGVVVTYTSTSPKNSFVKLENDKIIEVAEKKVISNIASTGIYFWKRAVDFIFSANLMISKDSRVNGEFYVAPTYQQMIDQGLTILNYHVGKHIPLGTPEDFACYLLNREVQIRKIAEFKGGWFCGDFNPAIYKTKQFEVGTTLHKKGESWPKHYHQVADEITLLIQGQMLINGKLVNEGDVFFIPAGLVTEPKFLTDCKVVVIKTPSIPGDKYIV